MDIGILTYALDRPLTGIGRYTLELLRALSQIPDVPRITLLAAGGIGEAAAFGFPVVTIPGSRLLPGLLTAGNMLLPFIVQRLKLDLIHDPTGVTPFAFISTKAKKVVTIHDVFPLSYPGVSTHLDSLIYRWWLPRVIPNADAVITISRQSHDDIVQYLKVNKDRIHVMTEGVHVEFQPADYSAIEAACARYQLPERYILYVGSVEERKNLKRVIEAFSQLDRSDLKLVIVGPHKWQYADILQTAAMEQVAQDVIFTGFVQQRDLPAVYSGARCFVFPSLYEGFGLPVLEAMACGTPVITSNVSSLPEVAGDAALLVDPYDTNAIANAMTRLLTDASLHHELRKKGLLRAREFTWKRTAYETLNVYRQLLRQ